MAETLREKVARALATARHSGWWEAYGDLADAAIATVRAWDAEMEEWGEKEMHDRENEPDRPALGETTDE